MKKNHLFWLKNALFLAFLVIFDQITKYLAKAHLKGEKGYTIIKNTISFNYLNGGNTGVAWGILSGRIVLFIVFTIIAVLIIFKFIVNISHFICLSLESIPFIKRSEKVIIYRLKRKK